MKISANEVCDLRAGSSMDELENWSGQVPGARSVPLNYQARDVAVRHDEIRIEQDDIRCSARPRAFEPVSAASASQVDAHERS